MLSLNSLTFGPIEVDEAGIHHFPRPIPGLSGIDRYCVYEPPDMEPFRWLQSCDSPHISLMTVNPWLVDPDYRFKLADEYLKILGGKPEDPIEVLALVVVPDDPREMTANLLAPIVLNQATKKGTQVVLDGTSDMLRMKVLKD